MIVSMTKPPDIPWLSDENVRPYVYMRKENLYEPSEYNAKERDGVAVAKPGSYLKCAWFKQEPIYKNPLLMEDVEFGNAILNLEAKAFQKSGMGMPRWVFYDCALVPGFVGGFARKTSTLSKTYCETIGVNKDVDWTPISLFIIIPSLRKGEWVAHNLCTANSLVGEPDQHYALGFLTKAFGLWYTNTEILCGMTQWQSPSIRLHSHYGPFEILTAYTPIHSYAQTLTYRSKITGEYWPTFFTREKDGSEALNTQNSALATHYKATNIMVDPKADESLKALQTRIQNEEGPFYLNPTEIRTQPLDAPLKIYRYNSKS